MKNDQNPATAHHTITTARRLDNIRSSILVQGQSIRSMARSCCQPRRPCPERIHISAILAGFSYIYIYVYICKYIYIDEEGGYEVMVLQDNDAECVPGTSIRHFFWKNPKLWKWGHFSKERQRKVFNKTQTGRSCNALQQARRQYTATHCNTLQYTRVYRKLHEDGPRFLCWRTTDMPDFLYLVILWVAMGEREIGGEGERNDSWFILIFACLVRGSACEVRVECAVCVCVCLVHMWVRKGKEEKLGKERNRINWVLLRSLFVGLFSHASISFYRSLLMCTNFFLYGQQETNKGPLF